MTRNNKVVLGVAAGVAALAVAGVYAKRKGYLNNINTDNLKDKWNGVKDTAMKALGKDGISNGLTSNSSNSMNANSMPSESSTNGSATKRKSTSGMNTGNVGNINPATT